MWCLWKCYKGQFPTGVEVAVKVLVDKDVVEEMFMAEISTMGRTYHRNLIKLYGFCFDDKMKALVYEYMKNGSLDKFLYENQCSITWEKLYDIAVQTAKGLLYLHDGCHEQIIHHDIKAANVLLHTDFSPKITDFGLAKLMDRDTSHLTMTRIRGTAGYAAPETFTPTSEITCKCDVYSFGMMLFEIFGRRKNRQGKEWFPRQVWDKFKSGQLDEIIESSGITGENIEKATVLCMVALWCIQFTPQTRPSISSVLTMLEKEILVTKPPNPFLPSDMISAMHPSQRSQELAYSGVPPSIDEKSLISSNQQLREQLIPGQDGLKQDKEIVVPHSPDLFSAVETWYQNDLEITYCGVTSSSELVIKTNARIKDPESEEIVRVLPMPSVLKHMKHNEMEQFFLQYPEIIRFLLFHKESSKKSEEHSPSGYLNSYNAMAKNIPSMGNQTMQSSPENFIPEQDGTMPHPRSAAQQLENLGSGAETVVTKWHEMQIAMDETDTSIIHFGVNSNMELVIKENAQIQDLQGEEIIRVLPRPSVLGYMRQKEIEQLFSQFPASIRQLICCNNTCNNSEGSAPCRYVKVYNLLARSIMENLAIQSSPQNSVPEQDGVPKPDRGCVILQQSAILGSGAEIVVTKWYLLSATFGGPDEHFLYYGVNSNSELVIKANAKIKDPRGDEIVRVLPRPTVLRHMKDEKIEQIFLQFPEIIRLLISSIRTSGKSIGTAFSSYLEIYKRLASNIPSMKTLATELEDIS